jgi:hypothetical protein
MVLDHTTMGESWVMAMGDGCRINLSGVCSSPSLILVLPLSHFRCINDAALPLTPLGTSIVWRNQTHVFPTKHESHLFSPLAGIISSTTPIFKLLSPLIFCVMFYHLFYYFFKKISYILFITKEI